MAITYQTKINKVRVQKDQDGLQNVITRVAYTVIATAEDGVSLPFIFELEFTPPDPALFIDISNVDEPTLVGWVESHERFRPMPEYMIEDRIQFERNRPFIEEYPFDFLQPIVYN